MPKEYFDRSLKLLGQAVLVVVVVVVIVLIVVIVVLVVLVVIVVIVVVIVVAVVAMVVAAVLLASHLVPDSSIGSMHRTWFSQHNAHFAPFASLQRKIA